MEPPDLHNTDGVEETQPDAAQVQRWSGPMVRELTPRDLDEQRRLVRASLLATRA
jgi:hypothetical protein